MRTKHILAFTACLITALAITARGNSEDPGSETDYVSTQLNVSNEEAENSELDNLLPFGLKFGDSFDVFTNKLKAAGLTDSDLPDLEKAQSNDGYLAKPAFIFISIDADDYLGYTVFGSDTLASALPISSMFGFSFNQNKELYEWDWFCGDLDYDIESNIEYALNCMIDTYNDLFGFDGTYNDENRDDNNECFGYWETDTLRATLGISNRMLAISFHNIEHDLNH